MNEDIDTVYSSPAQSSRASTRLPCDFEPITAVDESPRDIESRTQSPVSSTTSSTATFSSLRSGGGSGRKNQPIRTTVVAVPRSVSPIPFTLPKSTGKKSAARRSWERETTTKKKQKITSGSAKKRYQSRSKVNSSPMRAEDAWSFSESLTDLTPSNQVLAQVQLAAEKARDRLLARTTSRSLDGRNMQQIVYLDTSQPGQLIANFCPRASTRLPTTNLEDGELEKPANYPPALIQLLTGRPRPTQATKTEQGEEQGGTLSKTTPGYHGLMDQMTSQQVASLTSLSKLRYDVDAPIAADIHGPLAIFDKNQLTQLYDAYGCDATAVEYVLSLLAFVEPCGSWARQWASKRLNESTSGLHNSMLASFLLEKNSENEKLTNWMTTAGFTIDPKLQEPDANSSPLNTAEEEKIASTTTVAVTQISTDTMSVTSVRQMATVQPLQRLPIIVSTAAMVSTHLSLPTNTTTTTSHQPVPTLGAQQTSFQLTFSYQQPLLATVAAPFTEENPPMEESTPIPHQDHVTGKASVSPISDIYPTASTSTPTQQIVDSKSDEIISPHVLAVEGTTISNPLISLISDVNKSEQVKQVSSDIFTPAQKIPEKNNYNANQSNCMLTADDLCISEPSVLPIDGTMSEIPSVSQTVLTSTQHLLDVAKYEVFVSESAISNIVPICQVPTTSLEASCRIFYENPSAIATSSDSNLADKVRTSSSKTFDPETSSLSSKDSTLENSAVSNHYIFQMPAVSNPSESNFPENNTDLNLSIERALITKPVASTNHFQKPLEEWLCEIKVPSLCESESSNSTKENYENPNKSPTFFNTIFADLKSLSPEAEESKDSVSLPDVAKPRMDEDFLPSETFKRPSSLESVVEANRTREDYTECTNSISMKSNNTSSVGSLSHIHIVLKESKKNDCRKTEPLSPQEVSKSVSASLNPSDDNTIIDVSEHRLKGEQNWSSAQNSHRKDSNSRDYISRRSSIQESIPQKDGQSWSPVSSSFSAPEPDLVSTRASTSYVEAKSQPALSHDDICNYKYHANYTSERNSHSLISSKGDFSNTSPTDERNVDQPRTISRSEGSRLSLASESSNASHSSDPTSPIESIDFAFDEQSFSPININENAQSIPSCSEGFGQAALVTSPSPTREASS